MLLNMPISALTLRTMLLTAMLVGRTWAADGLAPAEAVDPGIESCARIAADPQRLACFDRELSLMQAQRHASASAIGATAAGTPANAPGATVMPATGTPAAGKAAPGVELTPEQQKFHRSWSVQAG
jgi:hypothetical protein